MRWGGKTGGFFRRKIHLPYTDVLTNIQIVNSEVIVISRRVSPPLPHPPQSEVLKASLFKVSLTGLPFILVILVDLLFLSRPDGLYLQWGASRARAGPQSASAGARPPREDADDESVCTDLTLGFSGFCEVEM